MGISKAKATWTGDFKGGTGTMQPEHATEIPFTAASRFEGKPSSNPEELLGAALAGCFSMALTVALGKAGYAPKSVHTTAETSLERQTSGFAITGIALTTVVAVDGLDAAQFEQIANETKANCPVSKALAATPVSLTAKLAD